MSLICSKFNQKPTTVKSNLAKLNIFFGELNYQTITQIKSYNFGSLLGDIGGQMGLFIGASILWKGVEIKNDCLVYCIFKLN